MLNRLLIILMMLVNAVELFGQKMTANDSSAVKNIKDLASDPNPEDIVEYFTTSKILYSLIIILATYVFIKIMVKLLGIWSERTAKYRITIKGLIPIIRLIIWIFSLTFIIMVIFHPPWATVLAFSASVGVAVGFAAQDLLKNIFGGLTILFDRPFQVGDKVEIANYYGEVVEVGLRSTRIQTLDDNLVSVPNGLMLNQSVANANASEQNCQVNTFIFLPVDYDIDYARKVAFETARVSRYIYLNKPVVILFNQEVAGQNLYLKMTVKAYVNDIRNESKFKSELTETLSDYLIRNKKD